MKTKNKRKHHGTAKTFKTLYKQLVRKSGDFINDFFDDTKYLKTKGILIFFLLIMGSALEDIL